MKTKTILALAAFTLGSAHAAVLVNPTSIAYTTTPNQEEGLNLNDENNLINGNGLSATPDITNYTSVTHARVSFAAPGNVWATIDPAPAGGDFYAQGGIAPSFEMTFDQAYNLTDFVYWGYHFDTPGANEGREFFFEFSNDGGTTYPSSTTVSSPLGTLAVTNSATLSFSGTFQADAIRMTILDNHFGAPNGAGGTIAGGDRVGMGEVKFIGDAIPEPSTSLLGGLALLALLRRRR